MPRSSCFQVILVILCSVLAQPACAQEPAGSSPAAIEARLQTEVEQALAEGFRRIWARADTMDDILHPIPLLRPGQEAALRQYVSSRQLVRARELGVAPVSRPSALEPVLSEGRLVRMEDSTRFWITRELDHSHPFVTPDVRAMLTELGTRFHARLAELGLPPLRMEISSVLRTTEDQAALRGTNPNAARGTSTHEYGTTVDVAYAGFAAPAQPIADIDSEDMPWLTPYLHRVADAVAETVAARRSRELQAILGLVLLEMQEEGKVMVLLERQQPVYHLTVATRY